MGRAVAIGLSSEGYRVALTSRSEEQLHETAISCSGETSHSPASVRVSNPLSSTRNCS
ncbi:hypothetical protein [Mycobacterium triplex]|uniref:hypothetical protein n=1 Tax=Mycobacterium triplex TaxID=47839 RepID=UPI00111C1475